MSFKKCYNSSSTLFGSSDILSLKWAWWEWEKWNEGETFNPKPCSKCFFVFWHQVCMGCQSVHFNGCKSPYYARGALTKFNCFGNMCIGALNPNLVTVASLHYFLIMNFKSITKHNIPCGGSLLKPQKPHPYSKINIKKKKWAQITPISEHNDKISEYTLKEMDTKVCFVGVGYKCPNTKFMGKHSIIF